MVLKIDPTSRTPSLSASQPLNVQPLQCHEEVRHVRLPQQLGDLPDHSLELSAEATLLLPLHGAILQGAGHHIHDGQEHRLTNVDGLPVDDPEAYHRLPDLPPPERVDGVKAGLAKHLPDADLSQHPPLRAIGVPHDITPAVGDDPGHSRHVAVGAGGVVVLEHLLGSCRRADDDGRLGSEAEAENGARDGGELGEAGVQVWV